MSYKVSAFANEVTKERYKSRMKDSNKIMIKQQMNDILWDPYKEKR